MGPNQTSFVQQKKPLKKKKRKYSLCNVMGKNICKWCDKLGLNLQSVQTVHRIKKKPNQNMRRP